MEDKKYETIDIDFPDEVIIALAQESCKKNITISELVEMILISKIGNEKLGEDKQIELELKG